MRASKLVHQILAGNRPLQEAVARDAGVSVNTVYFWLRTDSRNLTLASVLECLMRETDLKYDQLIDRGAQDKAGRPS